MYRVVVQRENKQEDTLFVGGDRNEAVCYYNDMLYYWRKRKMEWKNLTLSCDDKQLLRVCEPNIMENYDEQ